MGLFTQYPYLIAVLFGLAPVALAFLLANEQRFAMGLSGISLTILGLPTVSFGVDYWSPRRLGDGSCGIEDVLCCFSIGSLTWLAGVWPFRGAVQLDYQARVFWPRLFALGFLLYAGGIILWWSGLGWVEASSVVHVVATLALLRVCRDLWPLALTGLVCYPLYYCSVLLTASALLPGFLAMWDSSSLCGVRAFGLPVEELIWITTLTPMWLTMFAFCCDIREVRYSRCLNKPHSELYQNGLTTGPVKQRER